MRTAVFCTLAALAATAQAGPRIGHITVKEIPACKYLFEWTELAQFLNDADYNDYKQALAADMGKGDCSVMREGQTVYVDDSDDEQGFDFLSVRLSGQSVHWWIPATAVK